MLLPAFLLLFAACAPAADDLPEQIKRFVDVYAAVESQAADQVSPAKAFYEGAIPGMLRRLDPHSVFFDPGQFEQLKEMQKSTRKGFGSVVSVLPGRVIVLQTLPGTPSAKSGLAPGDEILAVNNIPLARLEMEQLIQVLTESRQQQAKLDVRRLGQQRLMQFVMVPEEMQSASVDRMFLMKPGVGYVRATSFDADTGKQIQAAIEKLGGAQLKALVLDLRNNPGGLLPAAMDTASLFLKPGQKILSVKGRSVQGEEMMVPATAKPYPFPVAVLINGRSASASEIVAGALQDHDRGTIVGEPSFGKGLVESVFPLSSSTGIALTTAFYYTPSGRSIQHKLSDESQIAQTVERTEFKTDSGRKVLGGGGIQPDVEVYPAAQTRLRMVMDATASFTSFATEYTKAHPGIKEDFEVTPAVLDDFQLYLSERGIRPGVSEWSAEREWIRNRLKTEIFNLTMGVEKGDEVELQRDPQAQRALQVLGQ